MVTKDICYVNHFERVSIVIQTVKIVGTTLKFKISYLALVLFKHDIKIQELLTFDALVI